jgi:putative transposase
MKLIDRCHMELPFYGSWRMVDWLSDEGYLVNRKRVQRFMRIMGIVAV